MVAKGWTEAQKRAYVIADNKLAMNAGWDADLLAVEFDELKALDFDLELTGFTLAEIDLLSGRGVDFEPGTEDDQGRLDEKQPIVCPACGHEFTKS